MKNQKNYRYNKMMEEMQKAFLFNKALEAELLYARQNTNDILEDFNDCMSMASVDKAKYQYCFDVLGICTTYDKNGNSKNFYNKTAAKELKSYSAKLIDNVFPQQKRNFVVLVKDESVDQFKTFYPTLSHEEIRSQINGFLQICTDCIHDTINISNFFELFLDAINVSAVRQFDLLIQPVVNSYQKKSHIVFKRILPFSIAYDYNDEQEVVGVYRLIRMRVKDVLSTYPDFDKTLLADKKPRQFLKLKECCFLKFIPLLNEYKWVYLLIDPQNKVALVRLLKFNPFITFCETLPLGSNVGRGKIFDCYEDIVRAEDQTKVLERVIKALNKPIFELVVTSSDDKALAQKQEINPGDVIKVRQPGMLRAIPLGQNPDAVMTLVQNSENNIRNSISGEILTMDPNATATLTTVQMAQRANFLASLQGKISMPLISQLVQKTSFILQELGVLQTKLRSYILKDPETRLPATIFTNEVKLDPELFEITLNDFIDALLEVFGDMSQLDLKILSNIGMRQKLDDVNNLTTGLQLIAQTINAPINSFISEERYLSTIIEGMGLPQSVFLTEEERQEKQRQMMEAQMLQQQAAQAQAA